MSTRRMSFNETPDWMNRIGFHAAGSIDFDAAASSVVIRKGFLIYGLSLTIHATVGFVVDSDLAFPVPFIGDALTTYLTIGTDGSIRMDRGDFANVRGVGANVPGIRWYTFNGRALIGKCFFRAGFYQGSVVCDDAFWCEFEGGF